MKRFLAVAALVWLVGGCDADDGGSSGEGSGAESQECAGLRCTTACIVDFDGSARCACDEGEFGDDCHPCPEGEQDHDGDGTCSPNCFAAALDCGQGYCDDILTGAAQCVCPMGSEGASCERCTFGFQDFDGNGTCEPSCALAEIACAHGTCDDASGAAACVCEPDWSGDRCDTCAEGLQDHDLDGVCLPTCASASPDCGHGECLDASGAAVCACFAGWEGEACDRCREGLSDENGDGICTQDG
jgi:hypothetical protein